MFRIPNMMHRVGPLLFLVLCCCTSCALAAAIDDEIEALLALKSSLIDPMGRLNDWVVLIRADNGQANYSISPCKWTGVSCNSSSGFNGGGEGVAVVALDLSSMNLSGFISADIGRLQNVENVSFAVNNLTGRLPPEITDMGCALKSLNISNNLFNGEFPAGNLSKLAFLEVLDAYNNNFSGPLPLEISKLTRLRHLHLGGNFFNGSIPPQYGDMQSLVYLALSGNSLTGRIPVELGNLALLQELYLGYYNVFDGGIPSALGLLTGLARLDMADCGLTGSIPPHLQNLTKLDSLFLQINSLSGAIPSEVGNMASLRSLDLSNNMLSGHIPAGLGRLANLELLNLFRNQLHGGVPSFIGNLPSLQVLSLWENNLTGSMPQHLGSNGKLVIVDLSTNSFSGPIPPRLCFGGNLQRLILFRNSLTGPIPPSLGNCTTLVRLRLGQNRLSGSIPSGLLALPALQMLEAPLNSLNGSLPSTIPFNAKLGRLDLSGNQLSGAIPSSIGSLSSLQTFLLPGNALSGIIPTEVGRLTRLSKLDLSGNSIMGSVPASLGECDALTYLDLSSNELEGAIPPDLQNLAVLDFLNLSRNHLSGSIPPPLQQMQSLTAADFSYNNLSGVTPDQGQFATFNASSFVGNPGLCGVQLPVACASTSSDSSSQRQEQQDQLRRRVQSEPALVYWVIVGVISSLTVVVFVVGVICNRHAFCALLGRELGPGFSGALGLGMESWKLTAFQKLDFTAHHVLACLRDENIIGKGGSGTVYKCATPSGYVAVKRLPGSSCSSSSSSSMISCATHQHKKQQLGGGGGSPAGGGGCYVSHLHDHGFSAEIQTLGKIRHRNIVRLLGCCSSRDTNLLVYEFMPNGSLGELLHGPRGGSLDWAKRFSIAVEAANGLRYLHHDCSPLIVHRDVKSNNILLDSKYEAHVADFGLAKALNYPESMSSVAGSYGYIAPEYVYTLKVDEKSDIYSFGIVLLELVTGRRPFEPEYGEGVDIAAWVRKKVQKGREGVLEVVDPRILGEVQAQDIHHQSQQGSSSTVLHQEVMLLLRVALHCLVELPMQRPTMREVVQMLTDHHHQYQSSSISSPNSKKKDSASSMIPSNLCTPYPNKPTSNNSDNNSNSNNKATTPSAAPAAVAAISSHGESACVSSPPDLISI